MSFYGKWVVPMDAEAKEYCRQNGTFFPNEECYFIEGFGDFYNHDTVRVKIVGEGAVEGLGGLDAEELSTVYDDCCVEYALKKNQEGGE